MEVPDDRLGGHAGIRGFEDERRLIRELGQDTEVARHHPNGHVRLLEVLVALRLVWERRPEVRLVVAGAGQAGGGLCPTTRAFSIIARYISEREVDTLLAEASLVALP